MIILTRTMMIMMMMMLKSLVILNRKNFNYDSVSRE